MPAAPSGPLPRVRAVAVADAAALKPLLAQLGYALEEPEIRSRIEHIRAAGRQFLVVAEDADSALAALLHVYGRAALEKPPEAVVQALVVRDGLRGQGLGRAMMALAEGWAREAGYRHISLSSQTGRDAAHAFYEGLGYARYATSHQFRKTLAE
jgi:GNAT superfamily N-acetyltransferase